MDINIYKLKSFGKWSTSQRLYDKQLMQVVDEVNAGLIDADLGSGLFKKRIARQGEGKRGGYRSLLAFKKGNRLIFLFGFSKNEKDNISSEQLTRLRQLSKHYLTLDEKSIGKLVRKGVLEEIN